MFGSSIEMSFVTITLQVSSKFPSFVLTVIVAVPGPIAVTLPSSTVATSSLSLLHIKVLSVASSGLIVAIKV